MALSDNVDNGGMHAVASKIVIEVIILPKSYIFWIIIYLDYLTSKEMATPKDKDILLPPR